MRTGYDHTPIGWNRIRRPWRETTLMQAEPGQMRRPWFLPALVGLNLVFWLAYSVDDWLRRGLYSGLGLDFSRFWAAALVFRRSPASAYRLSSIATAMAPLARYSRLGAAGVHLGPSPYPPIFLAVFALFTLPASPVGFFLWSLFNVAIGGIACWRLTQHFPLMQRRWITADLVLAYPLMLALFVGQVVAILLFCLTEGMLALDEGQEFRAGLWFGLLTLKPQYLPLLLVFVPVKRRWSVLFGGLASGLGLALASLAVGGVAGIVAYVRQILTIYPRFAGNLAIDPRLMINWRGLVVTVFPIAPATVGLLLVVALSLATLATLPRLWRGSWDPQSRQFQWQILGTLIVTLLTAYHSEPTGAALLLVPGALLLVRAESTPLARGLVAWLWLIPLVGIVSGVLVNGLVPVSVTMTMLLVTLLVTLLRHLPAGSDGDLATWHQLFPALGDAVQDAGTHARTATSGGLAGHADGTPGHASGAVPGAVDGHAPGPGDRRAL